MGMKVNNFQELLKLTMKSSTLTYYNSKGRQRKVYENIVR